VKVTCFARTHATRHTASDTFLLEGKTGDGRGVVARVKLTPTLKSCGAPLMGDTVTSNYEILSLQRCVRGQRFELARRKPDAQCQSESDVHVHKKETSCKCTESDWVSLKLIKKKERINQPFFFSLYRNVIIVFIEICIRKSV
jgi:hypothetical protein